MLACPRMSALSVKSGGQGVPSSNLGIPTNIDPRGCAPRTPLHALSRNSPSLDLAAASCGSFAWRARSRSLAAPRGLCPRPPTRLARQSREADDGGSLASPERSRRARLASAGSDFGKSRLVRVASSLTLARCTRGLRPRRPLTRLARQSREADDGGSLASPERSRRARLVSAGSHFGKSRFVRVR